MSSPSHTMHTCTLSATYTHVRAGRLARTHTDALCSINVHLNTHMHTLDVSSMRPRAHLMHTADAPRARQHARICAEEQLRAQSPMRRSAGLTGWWCGDARGSATSATQPIKHPTHSDRSPPPTARIGPKLGKNIKHWWYDGSPANRSAAIPRSLAISQDIY